jgi:hypothetical protein
MCAKIRGLRVEMSTYYAYMTLLQVDTFFSGRGLERASWPSGKETDLYSGRGGFEVFCESDYPDRSYWFSSVRQRKC